MGRLKFWLFELQKDKHDEKESKILILKVDCKCKL